MISSDLKMILSKRVGKGIRDKLLEVVELDEADSAEEDAAPKKAVAWTISSAKHREAASVRTVFSYAPRPSGSLGNCAEES